MSELEMIQTVLEKAAWRHRLVKGLRVACYGLLGGGVICLLLLGVYHLWPLPLWIPAVAALIPVLAGITGFIAGTWPKPDLRKVASWVDSRRRLKERLSTALEVSRVDSGTQWSQLLLADAVQHAKSIDPRQLLPLHLPQISRWALIVLALGAGLGFVPEYRSKSLIQKKTDQQNIKETGRLLAELT